MIVPVQEAIEALRAGEVVAIPTETVYGLAGRIDREETLKKIFELKARPLFDPLIVHVNNSTQAKSLCSEWPKIYDDLTAAFWPGPLTLVAPKNEKISPLITAGLPTVALRAPKHVVTQEILKQLQVPLAAPSANKFGRTSPTYSFHVEEEFAGQVKVVEGGACTVGVESTILSAKENNGTWEIQILRPGGISRLQLEEVLTTRNYRFSIQRAESNAVPGHLKNHYQPSVPLIIIDSARDQKNLKPEVENLLGRKVQELVWLNLPPTPQSAARLLYQRMRELSREGNVIMVQRFPEHANPDWEAVWDRLERASTLHLK